MALVWDKSLFDSLYERREGDTVYHYEDPARHSSLPKRMKTLMALYPDMAGPILLHGGAYGWGALPLLEAGYGVVNLETSGWVHENFERVSGALKPVVKAKGHFGTVIFEDSLADQSDDEIIESISWARDFAPSLIIILTSVDIQDERLPTRSAQYWRNLMNGSGNPDVQVVPTSTMEVV